MLNTIISWNKTLGVSDIRTKGQWAVGREVRREVRLTDLWGDQRCVQSVDVGVDFKRDLSSILIGSGDRFEQKTSYEWKAINVFVSKSVWDQSLSQMRVKYTSNQGIIGIWVSIINLKLWVYLTLENVPLGTDNSFSRLFTNCLSDSFRSSSSLNLCIEWCNQLFS